MKLVVFIALLTLSVVAAGVINVEPNEAVAIPRGKRECPKVVCRVYCLNGFEKGSDGCSICKCKENGL